MERARRGEGEEGGLDERVGGLEPDLSALCRLSTVIMLHSTVTEYTVTCTTGSPVQLCSNEPPSATAVAFLYCSVAAVVAVPG